MFLAALVIGSVFAVWGALLVVLGAGRVFDDDTRWYSYVAASCLGALLAGGSAGALVYGVLTGIRSVLT